MPSPSDLPPVASVEAAREVVTCAERTLAAPSARIELFQELRMGQADWPTPSGWRGGVLRLAVKSGALVMRLWWGLSARRGPNRGLAFGQMLGAGFAEPARGRYMIDFGSRATVLRGGQGFSWPVRAFGGGRSSGSKNCGRCRSRSGSTASMSGGFGSRAARRPGTGRRWISGSSASRRAN